MTVITGPVVNLATLKKVKNSVIGNPTAKLALARDEAFVERLVECINNPLPYLDSSQGSQDDIRIEASHVIASLAYGSSEALKSLLSLNAHQAFLHALHNLQPTDKPSLKAALARGLKALSGAYAEVVGPSLWGIKEHSSDVREDARNALDQIFEPHNLDIYLPLLTDSSTQTIISICQLLGSSLRSTSYRIAVAAWLPWAERQERLRPKRGWEKADRTRDNNAPARYGGWVSKELIGLIQRKDVKLQEAALGALAALTRENVHVALKLAKPPTEGAPSALQLALALCKARQSDLQLAACLCATSIIRSGNFHFMAPEYPSKPGTATIFHVLSVINVLNNIISSNNETVQTRTRACFTLYQLVSDDKDLCQLAYDRGSLAQLAELVRSITPSEPNVEWDEDEPESVSALREAAFTCIAAIALFDNDIRCEVTGNLRLVPCIQASLTHRHVGVRWSACQCVRALSRAVAVLRTNVVDTGLGLAVFGVFMKQDEDKRVMFAASAAVCNLMNDFSPLRPVLLEQGVVPRLVQLLGSDDPGLRLNAVWCFKNLLYKSTVDIKRKVMDGIGWHELACLLNDPDSGVQEHAFNIVQNLADTEDGIEMVFQQMGEDTLLGAISPALESEDENVVRQAVCVLGNLANSPTHHRSIITHPRILPSLRSCLIDAKVEIRRPAAACILELIRADPENHKEMRDAEIDKTLRHMCDYRHGVGASIGGLISGLGTHGHGHGFVSGSPTSLRMMGLPMGVEDDREVKERCQEALRLLESRSSLVDY
ncbi:ARM repeat-containing protein [Panus rudis PR-1116 ss-1]|nr:ARM repeat-containing protein [Panus rudis PR-1116 ss-1]